MARSIKKGPFVDHHLVKIGLGFAGGTRLALPIFIGDIEDIGITGCYSQYYSFAHESTRAERTCYEGVAAPACYGIFFSDVVVAAGDAVPLVGIAGGGSIYTPEVSLGVASVNGRV